MTDETEQTNDVLWAAGLDDWHAFTSNADAEQEKAAVEAENYQAERMARYLESGGADQIGGFVSPSPGGLRQMDWRRTSGNIDWR
jgi:hypothetical protein